MATSLRPSNNEKPCCQGTLCGRQQPSDHRMWQPSRATSGSACQCGPRPRARLCSHRHSAQTSDLSGVCCVRAPCSDDWREARGTRHSEAPTGSEANRIEYRRGNNRIRRTDHACISLSINTNLSCAVCIIPNFACTVVEVDVVASRHVRRCSRHNCEAASWTSTPRAARSAQSSRVTISPEPFWPASS